MALRAYALSVVEEERIMNSPLEGKYLNYSYPVYRNVMGERVSNDDTLVPIKMYTDDEIVEMSQTS